MSLCPSPDQLIAFLAGRLDDEEASAIDEHVKFCESCQGQLDRLSSGEGDAEWQHLLGGDRIELGTGPALTTPELAPVGLELEQNAGEPDGQAGRDPTAFPPRDGSPDEPTRLGRFQLLERLGSGAFATVYKARDETSGQLVAIKLLSPDFPADLDGISLLKHEFLVGSNLRDPHLVSLIDFGGAPGDRRPFIVMEYVEGETLKDRLERESLPPRTVVRILMQASHGLARLHRRSFVHRDLKPSNILLNKAGDAAIGDLGLAVVATPPSEHPPGAILEPGSALGTRAYMSPEQLRNPMIVDARSDVFSLGVILYEALMGRRPRLKHVHGGQPAAAGDELGIDDPLDPAVDPDLNAILATCLRNNPDRRYTHAEALAEDLNRWLMGVPILAPRTS